MDVCPLCHALEVSFYCADKQRDYWRCGHCELVYVPRSFWLSPEAEKAQYDLHENNPSDEGYRRFLNRLAAPLSALLPSPKRGLDFGCGPGPTLSLMMAEAGHRVELYDKFFYPDASVLKNSYDFITATEVVEHLQDPREVLATLWGCLKPGGVLALMTKRVTTADAFSRWHYKNDPTHIVFFHENTFYWLARHWQAKLSLIDNDVVFLSKS